MSAVVGQAVLYTVSEQDAHRINKRRADFAKYRKTHPGYEDTGYVAHYGNEVKVGDVFPAFVVRVLSAGLVNLHVLLDGSDTFWATSVDEGVGPRTWASNHRI